MSGYIYQRSSRPLLQWGPRPPAPRVAGETRQLSGMGASPAAVIKRLIGAARPTRGGGVGGLGSYVPVGRQAGTPEILTGFGEGVSLLAKLAVAGAVLWIAAKVFEKRPKRNPARFSRRTTRRRVRGSRRARSRRAKMQRAWRRIRKRAKRNPSRKGKHVYMAYTYDGKVIGNRLMTRFQAKQAAKRWSGTYKKVGAGHIATPGLGHVRHAIGAAR